MMRNLNEYSTQELYNELCKRDDVFSCILWVRKDVEDVVVPDKVDEFMDGNGSYFGDRCTELGWEVMADLADYDGVRKDDDKL